MTLSVYEGLFPIESLSYALFRILYIWHCLSVAVTGEDRNLKFGTDVDRNKSQ